METDGARTCFVQVLVCGSPDPRSVDFGQIDNLFSGVGLLTWTDVQ